MEIHRRHAMRKSDFREMKEKLRESVGGDVDSLFRKTAELIVTESGEFYAGNKEIVAFQYKNLVLPTLRVLNKKLVTLPTVTVDMGAVPYVTNGADIMAPGITKIDGEHPAKTIIMIIDEKYGKSLAVGELLHHSLDILDMKKGKAVKNIHYVNDAIWNFEL